MWKETFPPHMGNYEKPYCCFLCGQHDVYKKGIACRYKGNYINPSRTALMTYGRCLTFKFVSRQQIRN